jgi:Leucine-rich repeat (LRR) protein
MEKDTNDPDFILEIYYSNKGNLDQINAIIDAKLKQKRQRKISIFENYIKSRLLKNPKKLEMTALEINSAEATYLSVYPNLNTVEKLDLRQNQLGDRGLEAIASSKIIVNLKELDLRNNQITRVGMKALMASPNMKNLTKLDLRLNKMGGKLWFERLKETGNFPSLKDFRGGGF